MLSRFLRYGCGVLSVGFVFPLLAAPASTPHSRLTLVAERVSVQPGQEIQAGLHFELEKNWHIYWINPGDSGQPPDVKWKLPPQFKAGRVLWPIPKRLKNGSLVDYGYENEVLLRVPIHTPASLRAGNTINIKADVKWLVCHDICIPVRETVNLSLPVTRTPSMLDSRWRELFARTREQSPSPLPSSWSVTAVSNRDSFILSVITGRLESAAAFFPLNPLQIENAAPQAARPFQQGVRLSLQKSQLLLHPVASLKGILVLRGDKAYAINATVISKSNSRE